MQKKDFIVGPATVSKVQLFLLIQRWERHATVVSDRTSDDESCIAAVSEKSNICARLRGQIGWQRVT
jgi:hypothetical protein